MDNVTPFRAVKQDPSDIPQMLREIADTIERGEVPDMPVITTAAVVLGHSVDTPLGDGRFTHESWHQLYGAGPRADAFTMRGLLTAAADMRQLCSLTG